MTGFHNHNMQNSSKLSNLVFARVLQELFKSLKYRRWNHRSPFKTPNIVLIVHIRGLVTQPVKKAFKPYV